MSRELGCGVVLSQVRAGLGFFDLGDGLGRVVMIFNFFEGFREFIVFLSLFVFYSMVPPSIGTPQFS